MHIDSHESPKRGKATGKPTIRKTAAAKVKADGGKMAKNSKSDMANETLHLKAKQFVATPDLSANDFAARIATAAYYRAAERGFAPGHELEDWLQAEQHMRAQASS